MKTKSHFEYGCGRIIPDPPTKAKDYCGQGLKRYDYWGNLLTGPALTGPALTGPALTGPALTGPAPTKKLRPVKKIKLKSSSQLHEDRFYKLSKEEIKALPPTSWWTPGLPPGAREDWIAWAIDRMRVLGLTYERLYEQAKVQKANGIYSKKDIERLNLLLERLAPGKSVSVVLNR